MPKQSALFVLCQQLRLYSFLACFYSPNMSSDFPVITYDIVMEHTAFDGLNQ